MFLDLEVVEGVDHRTQHLRFDHYCVLHGHWRIEEEDRALFGLHFEFCDHQSCCQRSHRHSWCVGHWMSSPSKQIGRQLYPANDINVDTSKTKNQIGAPRKHNEIIKGAFSLKVQLGKGAWGQER